MTLLTMIQDCCNEIGITSPSAVVSSNDPNIKTLLALANTEGKELAENYGWQELSEIISHTTVAAELQGVVETIAPGYNYIVSGTFWDETLTQPVTGPLSSIEWNALKARTSTGPYSQYRIIGGSLYAYPAPPAGNSWKFEIQSRYWCQSSGGTNQERWAADTDVGRLNEDLMKLGIIWRFKKKNGLDYSEDFRNYQTKLQNKKARDGGKKFLDMQGGGRSAATGVYIPEGSWS